MMKDNIVEEDTVKLTLWWWGRRERERERERERRQRWGDVGVLGRGQGKIYSSKACPHVTYVLQPGCTS
jgi:hypothetical protein